MKKQKNKWIQTWIGVSIFFLLLACKVQAQNNLSINNATNTISIANDTSYQDFIIPAAADYNAIYLEAYGSDGGNATSETTKGGKGAKTTGYLRLGDNAIPTGSIIRFLVGVKGESKGQYGGGGGGTAVAVKRKGESTWNVIMVAGGGGGAGLKAGGREGTSNTSGSNGMLTNSWTTSGHEFNAGRDGNGGGVDPSNGSAHGDAGGGGGIYTASIDGDAGYGGAAGLSGNVPTGGAGGTGVQNQAGSGTWADGGWGFGGGGAATRPSSDTHAGGGGGGYSGGGGGVNDGGGGGGGSYVNTAFLEQTTITSNGTTSSPVNGKIKYRFGNLSTLERMVMVYTPSKDDATPLCLGVGSSTPTSGSQLKAVDCSKTDQVGWYLDESQLRLYSDLSLSVYLKNGSTSNNNAIQLQEYNTSKTPLWIYDGYRKAFRYKNNVLKCAMVNETTHYISIYDCTESHNQTWTIDGASTTPSFGANPSARRIEMESNSNRCIDINHNSTANGTNIQLYNCNGTSAQKWLFNGIQFKMYDHQDKCLDLAGGKTNDGANIQLSSCTLNNANQNWIYDGLTQGIRLQSHPDKCLDIVNANLASGSNLQLRTCDSSARQQFNIFPEAEVLFGSIKNGGNQCIDLDTENYNLGTNIKTKTCHGSNTQYWYIQDNYIQLAQSPALCLDLKSANDKDGTNIQLYACNGTNAQKWIFDTPYQFIRSEVNPTKCLFRDSNNNIELTTCNYDNPEKMQWDLPGDYSDILAGNNLRIHLKKNEGKCVDMAKNEEDGNLRVYTCKERDSQYFAFDGGTIKRANDPNLCVDIEWGNMANGTNIRLWHCNGTAAQKWVYDAYTGRIHSQKDFNKCMRFTNGYTTNGTNVKISDCNNDKAEIFIIK